MPWAWSERTGMERGALELIYLPPELQQRVAAFLPASDVARTEPTCKALRFAISRAVQDQGRRVLGVAASGVAGGRRRRRDESESALESSSEMGFESSSWANMARFAESVTAHRNAAPLLMVGAAHSGATDRTGRLHCWGMGSFGALGLGHDRDCDCPGRGAVVTLPLATQHNLFHLA